MIEGLLWVFAIIFLLFGFVVIRGAPYVPSHKRFARQALTELYPLTKDDVIVDLGSGDGGVLRTAREKGATAIGYELNPILVFISRVLSRGDTGIRFEVADMWTKALPPETTVVYAFVVSRDTKKLEQKLQSVTEQCGHPVSLVTYGAMLRKKQPVRVLNAHALYVFEP